MVENARVVSFLVKEGISRHTRWRGDCSKDGGGLTLVTVNWHTEAQASQLIRSFRKYVGATPPVIVVDNSPSRNNRDRFKQFGVKYVTVGANVGHGLGLDLGMRWVETEFTLVCDPDTGIISADFIDEVLERLSTVGVASVDTGNPYYHPLCTAFRTECWKSGGFSFLQRWPWWDTAGELTHLLGGVSQDALIPKTRSFGPALPAAQGGPGEHFIGEVYGDVFTSTYLAARLRREPERDDFDGWSRDFAYDFHQRWNRWLAAMLDDRASVSDFPQYEPERIAPSDV